MAVADLPPFPWDELAGYSATAARHPDGLVNLSIGTPVDPVPGEVQAALAGAARFPGYPAVAGSPELRQAIVDWLRRELGSQLSSDAVLPTIGSKELIAWLPTLLGLGEGDVVAIPELAYPTYEVGARMAGAAVQPVSLTAVIGGELHAHPPALLWLNSPSNPTGAVHNSQEMAAVVAWARDHGTLVASDECYLGLGFESRTVSALDRRVCGNSYDGVLAVHSLSKRSNLAGYRAGFVAGDAAVVSRLLAARKQLGMIVSSPVQAAMVAALRDSAHAHEQRDRYLRRRGVLRGALEQAGFRVDHSQAGLYLWVSRGEDCWDSVAWFAERGILVAPGSLYGPTGARHVRVGLTALDDRIAAAAERISG